MKLVHNIYCLIDSVPELPYFILALAFVFTETVDKARHVLAVVFIYVILALAAGILVKYISRSERPKERYRMFLIEYDVPSLHTLIAVGLVFFAYFINPLYSLLLTPIGLLYMRSRVCLGFHTKKAVVVGAWIGALVGFATGYLLWKITLSEWVELLFVILVLIIPLFATYLRIVNYRRLNQD
jgi:membrane-associated phospholipid phosphatase